jgi:putative iron-only hydrogenase system regulator
MEKRLGIIAIVITDKMSVVKINGLLSQYSDIIIARQGIPMPQRNISFISLVVESEMDVINQLTGKLGKLDGVEVKTIVRKSSENHHQ